MSSLEKNPGSKSLLSVQAIVLSLVGWAVLALLFFALFGITARGETRPLWYSIGTSIFEATAFLVAALLCFRNWGSSQIVSGRSVWLNIGLGMLFYFIGNLVFSYWELVLGLEPAVSPGDFFFILTYIFLLIGMVQAVFSRRLNLELWQKGVVVGIAVVGIAIGIALATNKPAETAAQHILGSPAYAQSQSVPTNSILTNSTLAQSPSPSPAASEAPAATDQKPQPPEWALNLERILQPLEGPVTLFYLVVDTMLLVLATTLLLAFWGGRFSQSWRMIAIAAFFLYLGDVWFKYATRDPNYQSGSLPEVAWVFSGVFFGIGAALEYDLSMRSRRTSSRRR
ncbi:MAG: hypothetical protein NW224_11370 [Leptolyngbyaceae cyanobacterium bins.302]|nr:hypothetical protein [Leptolyngbyaceae cyanobacterium bins.302]